jgi:hypothetical protein
MFITTHLMPNLATTMPIIHDDVFYLFSYEFCITSSLGRILSFFLVFDMFIGVMDDYE